MVNFTCNFRFSKIKRLVQSSSHCQWITKHQEFSEVKLWHLGRFSFRTGVMFQLEPQNKNRLSQQKWSLEGSTSLVVHDFCCAAQPMDSRLTLGLFTSGRKKKRGWVHAEFPWLRSGRNLMAKSKGYLNFPMIFPLIWLKKWVENPWNHPISPQSHPLSTLLGRSLRISAICALVFPDAAFGGDHGSMDHYNPLNPWNL